LNEQNVSRERFLGLGVLAGAGFLAASCGGGSDVEGGSESTAKGESAIANESDVPTGSAVEFEDSGNPAVLVHLEGGEFVAYSAVCTHQGCTVAYEKDTNRLACPCHGSVFDPAKGAEVLGGPAPRPLPEIPVQVQNGKVVKA
jgi:arsenite oxidase small subunit